MAFIISHKKLKKVVATVLCVSREGGDKLTTYEKKTGRRYRNNDHYCVRIMGLECLFKKT